MAVNPANQSVRVAIGITNTFGEKGMITMPIGNTGTPQEPEDICTICLEALETELFPEIQSIMSNEAWISSCSVHGQTLGRIPAQEFYPSTSFPGTVEETVVPAQVCGIISFYGDPDDMSPGNRLRIARNFFMGLAETLVQASTITGALLTAMDNLKNFIVTGWNGEEGSVWKRLMRNVQRDENGHPVTDDEIPVVMRGDVQEKVRTQRRRLKPDF